MLRTSNRMKKHVPDLLESLMRPTCLVKEELRLILFKMDQFRPKIIKIRVCTFQMSGKIPDSAKVAREPAILTPAHPLFAISGRASGQIYTKTMVLAPFGLVTLVL